MSTYPSKLAKLNQTNFRAKKKRCQVSQENPNPTIFSLIMYKMKTKTQKYTLLSLLILILVPGTFIPKMGFITTSPSMPFIS